MKNTLKNILTLLFFLTSMKLLDKDTIQINPIYIASQEIIFIIRGWQSFDDASLNQDYIFNKIQLEGEILQMSPFRLQLIQLIRIDCHANGQLNASTHPIGDIISQATRHFLDSPSRRGVYI